MSEEDKNPYDSYDLRMVRCEFCGAAPGQYCTVRNSDSSAADFHEARVWAKLAARKAWDEGRAQGWFDITEPMAEVMQSVGMYLGKQSDRKEMLDRLARLRGELAELKPTAPKAV